MPALRDRLRQAELSVTSPHEVLHLDGTGAGDLAVTVPPGALRGWTEPALEREISGLIDAALRASRRAYVRLRREVFDPRRADDADPVDDFDGESEADYPAGDRARHRDSWRSRPRTETFRDAVDEITVFGMSQRGYMQVSRDETRQFHVAVRRGMLRQLQEPEIAQEISSALAAALASYSQGYDAAFRSAFGSEPGFSRREDRP